MTFLLSETQDSILKEQAKFSILSDWYRITLFQHFIITRYCKRYVIKKGYTDEKF